MAFLVDQFGVPYAPPRAEELSARALRDSLRDRQSLGSILTHVTPRRLVSIFAEADAGLLGPQIELADDIEERYPQVTCAMADRRMAVTSLKWTLAAGDETPDSQEAVAAAWEWWEELDTRKLIDRLMDATLAQWAIDQVLWTTDESRNGKPYWYPRGFEPVDARRLIWPQEENPPGQEDRPFAPRIMRDWTMADTLPLTPGKFICRGYRVRRGRPGKMALVRAIAAVWMFARYALDDFAILVEKWGLPFLIAEYEAGANETEIEKLLVRMAASSANRVVAHKAGTTLNVSEGTAHITSVPQEKLITLCDEFIDKVILGTTTRTTAAANNDSVSSPTHREVGTQLRDADAQDVAGVINRDLLRPWFEFNRPHFGAEAKCPRLEPTLAESPAPKERLEIYEGAGRLGLWVMSKQLYTELGLEMPPDTPEVMKLKGAAAANPFGMPPGGQGSGFRVQDGAQAAGRAPQEPKENDAAKNGEGEMGTIDDPAADAEDEA